MYRHIHVSLRDKDGRNIFALSEKELKSGGRKDAKYEDLKYVSQECEWFLGGVLDGITDGQCFATFLAHVIFLPLLHY
jgi:glutamine synthetase